MQELRKQRRRPTRFDEIGLFSGLLYCADCGSILYMQQYHTNKRSYDNYVCGSYRSRTHDCTAHYIRTNILTAGILENLRHITNYAAAHEQQFMELLVAQMEAGDKRKMQQR